MNQVPIEERILSTLRMAHNVILRTSPRHISALAELSARIIEVTVWIDEMKDVQEEVTEMVEE